MRATEIRFLKSLRIAFLVLPLVLALPAPGAELPAGKVVWWGQRDIFWHRMYSPQTNGALEINGETLTNIIAVTGLGESTLVLASDGTAFAIPRDVERGEFTPASVSNVAALSADWMVKRDGTAVRWGNGTDLTNPARGLSNLTAIVPAGRACLALDRDGLLSWLYRREQPEVDNVGSEYVPEVIHRQVMSNVSALTLINETPFIVKKDGTVASFDQSQDDPSVPSIDPATGLARTNFDLTPPASVVVDGQPLSNVTAIAGGSGHFMALKRDGTVVTWGRDAAGEMAAPAGLSNITAIAAAEGISLALKSDGTVVAWGNSASGRTSVPAGLSNVVAIVASGWTCFAITTGNVPPGVYIHTHGRLEEMEREADVIFKGRVISDAAVSNSSFVAWAKPHATRFQLISVLKGTIDTNEPVFWHYTGRPMAWGGSEPPLSYQLETGRSYLIFAGKLGKPEWLYTPPTDAAKRPGEFHQLHNGGVTLTLDDRPLSAPNIREAHWLEFNLLLKDTNPTNQLYAIEQLDSLSLAGRRDDEWTRSEDFKRKTVLDALLPLVTSDNTSVAVRAMNCFATESNAAVRLAPYAAALAGVANGSRSPAGRLAAISALSGISGGEVSNSLAQLLNNADENIRVGAVRLLPRFPDEFAEQSLREMAGDPSPNVRSVVADVIGEARYVRLLPTLAKLFADPVGKDPLIKPMTMDYLKTGLRWNNIGDVHTSAGLALVQFEPDQVAGILRSNLNDPGFHINFVSKLAEKDAGPWLPELAAILEARIKYVAGVAKLPAADPRKFADPSGDRVLIGTYAKCWEDIRQYLMNVPAEQLTSRRMNQYMDLLDKTVRSTAGCAGCSIQHALSLYELYRMRGLTKRAREVPYWFGADEAWRFREYDRNHPSAVIDQ